MKLRSSFGIKALLEIISILDAMAHSEEFVFLNPMNFLSESNSHDVLKVNKVFEYTTAHFRDVVSLSEVASLVNLTAAAFCRYFKARTRKSYFQYLTEVRIASACKMLLEVDMDVAQVCYSNGFNNPSNFHKQFKKIVGLTPKEYRQKGQEITYI
jgi:AraC-like DNA-binding protein